MANSIIFDRLDSIKYAIRTNSTLEAVIPSGGSSKVVNVSPAYKRGTFQDGDVSPYGAVIFDFTTIAGGIKINYTPKADLEGDDSFEFLISYDDGTHSLQPIDMVVRPKKVNAKIKERFVEYYFEGGSKSRTVTFNAEDLSAAVPTKITVSTSDSGFNVETAVSTHHNTSTDHLLEYYISGGKLTSHSHNKRVVTGADNVINSTQKVDVTYSMPLSYNGDDYAIIKFKDFTKLHTCEDSDYEEHIYVTFHARRVNERNDHNISATVKPYERPEQPVLTYPSLSYPDAPERDTVKPEFVPNDGDLLRNTLPHREIVDGNKSIRLGQKVPEGAVNLGYYYNTTASFDDTVSVIETNTNVVTMKYVEEFMHKSKLKTNNDNQFPTSIEFTGKEGTDMEGYWGILYRDYVMWDEKVSIDEDPELIVVYEEFYGLQTNRVPMKKYYNEQGKRGVLDITNSIFEAIDFKRDYSNMTNKGFIPKRWKCFAKYEGIVKKSTITYDGSAKYSGVVTKRDGMSNIDPESTKEFLMFPDENGMLYDENGNNMLDDDLFYITDKFKDNVPLYYKHKLKYRVYDSKGPNRYGEHSIESIKLITENHDHISEEQKYKVILEETIYDNVYDAYVYTSFVPTLECPIYVMYDGLPEEAYMKAKNVNPLSIKTGIIEKLSVVQAFDTDSYTVKTSQGLTQQSTITVKHYNIFDDLREKIKIEYVVTADRFSTPPIPVEVINHKYAIYSEKGNFKNEDMISSLKDIRGFMTAKDMLLKYITEDEAKLLNKDTVYKVKYNLEDRYNTLNNKDKVILYTDPDGKGLVYTRTYCDTGISDGDSSGARANIKLDADSIYKSVNGKIYKGYSVMCRNINQIVISSPSESDPLKGWYPKVRYSYFNKVYERIDNTMQLIYSVPEFYTQVFGKYGAPYIDVKEEVPKFIGNNTLKVKRTPMYIRTNSLWEPENVKVVKVMPDGSKKRLEVKSFNFEYGFIEMEDQISDNDKILIDYTYEEQYYHYKGYYEGENSDNKMISLDLNPSIYSTYTDTKNEVYEEKPSYELFNRTIHFFLRPMRVINKETGEVEKDSKFAIYHKFDTQEAEGPFDLHIGRIFVRHHASLKSTVLMDTRSRGGGIIEAMSDEIRRELEPDSDYYMDIGTLDGKPYQENSVILVRLDNRLLAVNGGRFSEDEIREAVQRWAAFGMYPIIEYVNVIYDEDLPQSTLTVNKHISNQLDFNAFIETSIVSK